MIDAIQINSQNSLLIIFVEVKIKAPKEITFPFKNSFRSLNPFNSSLYCPKRLKQLHQQVQSLFNSPAVLSNTKITSIF